MKVLQHVLIILLVAMLIFAVLPVNFSNAADRYDPKSAINKMDGTQATINDSDVTPFTKLGDTILTFLQIVSGIAAVIMIAVSGFRYIVETPEVKGEIKKTMLPIVIGIILVFFAVSIAKFFLGIFQQ